MKNKTKSLITATITSAFLIGCSQSALYSKMTDDNYDPKPKTCDIPVSREPLKDEQKKIGEVTIFQTFGYVSYFRKNEKVAQKEAKEKACSVGADGIANFREVTPSAGLGSDNANSRGDLYVNE